MATRFLEETFVKQRRQRKRTSVLTVVHPGPDELTSVSFLEYTQSCSPKRKDDIFDDKLSASKKQKQSPHKKVNFSFVEEDSK